jgi:hypothetical protein
MAEADVSLTPRHGLVAFPIRGLWNFWLWLGGEALIGSALTGRTHPIARLVSTPRSRLPAAEAKSSFQQLKRLMEHKKTKNKKQNKKRVLSFSICRSSHLSGLKRQSLTVGGMSRAGYSPATVTALAVPSYNPSMVKSSIRMGQEQVSGLGTGVTDAPSTGGIITFGSHTDIRVSSCKNSIRE